MKRGRYLYVLPAILFIVVFLVFPLVYNIYASFCTIRVNELVLTGGQKWVNMLSLDSFFWHAFKYSATFTLVVVSIEVVLGLGIALLIHDYKKGQGLWYALLLLPLACIPSITGVNFKMMLDPLYGIVNHILGTVGVGTIDFFTGANTAMASIILTDIWQWTPFCFVIFFAAISALPKSIYEAAEVQGTSMWKKFRYITLPLIKPLIYIVLVLRGLYAFKSFSIIWATTHGGPIRVTSTLPVQAYKYAIRWGKTPEAAVIGIFMFFFVFVICLYLSKMIVRSWRRER